MNTDHPKRIEIPVLPLRDVVVYPQMVIPLFVGRERSIKCLEAAMSTDKKVMLVAQREASKDEPSVDDLFSVGTVSSILQMLKLADGTVKVLVEGLTRARLTQILDNGDHFIAKADYFDIPELDEKEKKVLIRTIVNQFEIYAKLNKKIPSEVLISLNNINDIIRLADTIATHMPLKLLEKQSILEITNISERLEYIMKIIESEIDLLQLEKRIRNRIKQQMEKSQKEYYLNEQMKAIQKELSETENIRDEYEIIKNKIDMAKMPKIIKEKTQTELNKLKMMSVLSAEASVIRSYIDWMLIVPWNKYTKIKKNLAKAKEILDNDHFGLEEVKERILEYLSVQSRVKKMKGPILCLVGPPGVGKTSLGLSIAKATGRKYVRMALGGLRDEAEIRGHRKTYIGSMPGKLIQKISKVGVKNPLFLLDEIDKMSSDIRGDPASALLEALDPEQNISFNDHYLEVDYDLSDIMFIATANSTNIPLPLLDRMEVINISSYTEDEKFNIARKHLIPKQLKCNSLNNKELEFEDNAVLDIIRHYTREAGVRNLEREIAKLCRKVIKNKVINNDNKDIVINRKDLRKYLGTNKFYFNQLDCKPCVGQVTGLAWTEVGGEVLTIEAICMPGKGKLIYTGSLGEVMQESIQAALTFVRANANNFNINLNFNEKYDIHVHVPEGAIPKDGPSAGIAMCTALVSSLTRKPVRSDIAMTGEITLYGKVLAIGGLKEKLLAARRYGIKIVLIPFKNKNDLDDIANNIKDGLDIHTVQHINEVLNISLL